MRKNPTYVILDSGCTRNMGSMARVMAFVRYCEQWCSWITFEWRWQPVKFSFANSHWSWVYWTLVIHYDLSDTASADQCFSIEISVLEEGDVPILLSNKMMGIMNLDIINREECTFINCPCLGLKRAPAELSMSNHHVIDLTTIVSAPRSTASADLVRSLADTVPADPATWYDVTEKKENILRCFDTFFQAFKGDEAPEVKIEEDFEQPEPIDHHTMEKELDSQTPAMSSRARPRAEEKVRPSELDLSLKRIHQKLRDPTELLKLHLKDYHMTTEQFKLRTTQLNLPKDIIDMYDTIVKKCSTCSHQSPVPARSRVKRPEE